MVRPVFASLSARKPEAMRAKAHATLAFGARIDPQKEMAVPEQGS